MIFERVEVLMNNIIFAILLYLVSLVFILFTYFRISLRMLTFVHACLILYGYITVILSKGTRFITSAICA